MFISANKLMHYAIHATDDKVGGIRDILFDDDTYVVRYLVADTNTWLPLSRKVVISPISVTQLDSDDEHVNINMNVDTLKNSPSIDEHKPVSREYEEHLFKYFGYGYYWIGPGTWGEFAHPTELAELQRVEVEQDGIAPSTENHLRACDEVCGYEVSPPNENVGHVSDFIIDTHSWKIVLLVVDTNTWLPGGKHLALMPEEIQEIDWAAHCVNINLSNKALLQRPQVDTDRLPESGYLERLLADIQ